MTILAQAPKKSKATRKSDLVVSLALSINHQVYLVTPIRAEDPEIIRAWRLEKRGADGAVYDVALTVHGHECDCPDFEMRRRGLDASGCKHVKACVRMGLLEAPAPIAPTIVEIVPQCLSAPDATLARTDRTSSQNGEKSDAATAILDRGLELAQADDCSAAEAEFAGDPSTWPSWVDNFYWMAEADVEDRHPEPDAPPSGPADEPEPEFEPSHDWQPSPSPYEPSEDDRDELGDWSAAMGAREHLDASERLTLAELIDRQADFYRGWDNPAGEMFAGAMDKLALQCRLTDATTPDELDARVEILHQSIAEQHAAAGYDAASARFAEPAGTAFGHSA